MTGQIDSLAGRRALVTGASSGIGAATATAFLRAGARVVATGRRPQPMADLAGATESSRLRALAGDLRDRAFVERLAGEAGPIDILVNCAGVLRHAPFLDLTAADWQEAFEVNVLSVLELTQHVARGMVARRQGHIINISSTRADDVAPMTMIYSATKHALRAISKGLRAELRAFGIRVTEIAPGFTASNIRRDVTHPAVVRSLGEIDFTPLEASDVARAVLFAATADPNCSTDLLVVRPFGQA